MLVLAKASVRLVVFGLPLVLIPFSAVTLSSKKANEVSLSCLIFQLIVTFIKPVGKLVQLSDALTFYIVLIVFYTRCVLYGL